MRKLMLGAIVALALPAAALAEDATPSPTDLAATACKTEKSEMGAKKFKLTYGAVKSMAKAKQACLAKNGAVAATELKNAAKECKAERALDAAAFAEKYGTNANKKNAYGKCVSSNAKESTEQETEDRVSAADACKKMKSEDKAGFEAAYGTKKNAFGKCVSKTAAAQEDDDEA
jgi:hypothetical protein